MDEWDSSKSGGNVGTIYSPTRRQTRTNKLPVVHHHKGMSMTGSQQDVVYNVSTRTPTTPMSEPAA